jgi:4,4'-diaponeurosporenoate glycosyltransferase
MGLMPTGSPRRLAGQAVALATGAWLLWSVEPPEATPAETTVRSATVVSVVIPARNEEASLPHLLASLARQTRPPDEVIVVDDASEDATAALAAAGGAQVLVAPRVPPGWLGKPNACHHGVGHARGDLLVFLDADVVLAPDAIERLVSSWCRQGGLVSVQPAHRTLRAYEQLSAVCNLVAMMGTGAFTGRPRRAGRVDMAFGPCLAVSRDVYDLVGGHAHPDVRDKAAEDVALARRVRATGQAVQAYAGGDVVGFRMYPGGARQLVNGWSKMLAGGSVAAPIVPALATAVWVTGALQAVGDGVRAVRGPHRLRHAAVYLAWVAEMHWLLRRVGRWRPWTAAAFPVPLVAFVGLWARSAVLALSGRPTRWRGRAVASN